MTPQDMDRFDRLPEPVRHALISAVMNIQNIDAIERACQMMPAEAVAAQIRQFDRNVVQQTTVLI